MGKKTKVGKQRQDRFYRLAKETGFRSRSAFKLLQLNRKFGFLESSRVLIDLCAAPGGWMQVAKQNMPVSSLIVGVDLYPIKPIPGCVSLVEDITTSKCKSAISKHLQTWKADVVLHDGAPNVGTNWILDAYQQSCLALSALKLATEFLREGGWFITKIFRSKDYDSLLWVFQQLFKKVQATKPQASRSESAEIFVVCQKYKAPDELDPKFFKHQYVFKELELETSNSLNVFNVSKQKKVKAMGYKDGDYLLFNSVKVTDFIKSENPIEILQRASAIEFDDEEILNHPKTTKEIQECFKDIKVLNRKDVRSILNWCNALKEEAKMKNSEGQNNSEKKVGEFTLSDEEEKEMNEIDKHIAALKKEELREQKKKKKAVEKERKKLQEKMNLKMVLENNEDSGIVEENAIFRLNLIKSNKELNNVLKQTPEILAESDVESEDGLPKPKKVPYEKEKTHLDSSGKFYTEEESEVEEEKSDLESSSIASSEGLGLKSENENDQNESKKSSTPSQKNKNPLLTDLDNRGKVEKRLTKVQLWFEKENLKNLETEADEEYDLDILSESLKKQGKTVIGEQGKKSASLMDSKKENQKDEVQDENSNSSSDSDTDSDESDSEKSKKNKRAKKKKKNEKDENLKKKKLKLDEEGLALGALMVSSNKKKRDLVDSAWNRYAFNDENLPDWFVLDEKENMTQKVPVPEEMVQDYKNRLKELNVRPIKKIVEAKARKKRKMMKSLEKAKKKMEVIMENVDISEREKIRNIQKLYKKAKSKKKSEVTYIVAKKATTAKKFRRPKGVKGRYRIVDPRMKKDMRRIKNQNKKNRKKKSKK